MIWLRKALIRLRAEYQLNKKKLFLVTGGCAALLAVVSLLLDASLPMEGWANVVRSILLLPLAASIFSAGYSISLYFHFKRLNDDMDWVPFRSRFSPSWRRRIALICGALLFVLVQAQSQSIGYTLSSSCIGAAIIAILAFIRLSKDEEAREELGVPDARDVIYSSQKRQMEREIEAKKAAKKAARKKKGKNSKAKKA